MRRVALLVIVVALVVPPVTARAQGAGPHPRSITVTGVGTATVRPDTAYVTAGVVTQAESAGTALSDNTTTMKRVLAALRDLGVRAEDVRTVGLSVTPLRREVRDRPPAIAGYEVQNRVSVRIRDLTEVGRALDRMVAEGANALGGVTFSVADPSAALTEARDRAVADARRSADTLARAAGVKLGDVLRVSEAQQQPLPRFGPLAATAAAVPIEPGEQPIRAAVTVTFAIE